MISKRDMEVVAPRYFHGDQSHIVAQKETRSTFNRVIKCPGSPFYERLFVEHSSHKESKRALVSFQFSVSLTPRCPIPSGPIGWYADWRDVMGEKLFTACSPLWFSTSWFMTGDDDNPLKLFELLREFPPLLDQEVESEKQRLLEAERTKWIVDALYDSASGAFIPLHEENKFAEFMRQNQHPFENDEPLRAWMMPK